MISQTRIFCLVKTAFTACEVIRIVCYKYRHYKLVHVLGRYAALKRISFELFSGSTFVFCEVSRIVCHVTTKASSS